MQSNMIIICRFKKLFKIFHNSSTSKCFIKVYKQCLFIFLNTLYSIKNYNVSGVTNYSYVSKSYCFFNNVKPVLREINIP